MMLSAAKESSGNFSTSASNEAGQSARRDSAHPSPRPSRLLPLKAQHGDAQVCTQVLYTNGCHLAAPQPHGGGAGSGATRWGATPGGRGARPPPASQGPGAAPGQRRGRDAGTSGRPRRLREMAAPTAPTALTATAERHAAPAIGWGGAGGGRLDQWGRARGPAEPMGGRAFSYGRRCGAG